MADEPIETGELIAGAKAHDPDAEKREAGVVAAIREWRDAHIANGPIARDVGAWNHLNAALDHLAASLLKEI